MAYGLLIPRLGFYQDDWHFVYNAYARGTESMWPLLYSDGRPWAAWIYVAAFKLLGFQPIGWHLASLGLRWLTALFFWLSLRQLWPKNGLQNFAAVLLFLVHPFFILQPLAVAYAPHWLAFCLFAISLYTMLLAVQRRSWLAFAISVLAAFVEIFSIEYFVGLELVRAVVLWLAVHERFERGHWARFWKAWAAYLAVLLSFVLWRTVVFDGPRAVMPGVARLAADPLAGILYYAKMIWGDIVSILGGAWANTLAPALFNLNASANVKALVIGLAAAGLCFAFLSRWLRSATSGTDASKWRRQAFWVGLAWLLGGLAPAYAIDEVVFLRNPLWSSRLALAALPGAALLTWAALDWLLRDQRRRFVLLSALLGLAVAFHAHNSNEFSRAWEEEQRFYQQLALRAPVISADTAIISEEEFLSYMGDYPTSYAVNALYAAPGTQTSQIPIWFFPITTKLPGQTDNLFEGMELQSDQYISKFLGNSLQALYIEYSEQVSYCLWVLGEESTQLTRTSGFMQTAGLVSDLSRIQDGSVPSADWLQPARQDWCYYFEKGDLARQLEDWLLAAELWQQAEAGGQQPYHAYEFSPFVEAYLRLGEWEKAGELTRRANQITDGAEKLYCSLWQDLAVPAAASAERDAALADVFSRLNCAD